MTGIPEHLSVEDALNFAADKARHEFTNDGENVVTLPVAEFLEDTDLHGACPLFIPGVGDSPEVKVLLQDQDPVAWAFGPIFAVAVPKSDGMIATGTFSLAQ